MTLTALRQAIVDRLALELPMLRTCRAHQGRFDVDEIKRIYTAMPAVLVVLLGAQPVTVEGHVVTPQLRWGAFVVTGAGAGPAGRDDQALTIIDALMRIVPVERWGSSDCKRPTDLRFENLYTGEVDRQAMSLWLVSWNQRVDLVAGLDADLLDELERVHTDWDLAPSDAVTDATDEVEMEQEA